MVIRVNVMLLLVHICHVRQGVSAVLIDVLIVLIGPLYKIYVYYRGVANIIRKQHEQLHSRSAPGFC